LPFSSPYAQKYGEEKGNSRYLFRLFPEGPAKQATKIAGLPKPEVDALISWLKAGGPRSARVDQVLVEPHQPAQPPPSVFASA
jgi:hypothetical protein